MLPRPGQRAPPLLSFPPNTLPSAAYTATNSPTRRSPIVRALLKLPLVFIFLCLAWPWYAYLFSLVGDYLWLERQQRFKAALYGAVFLWLDVGAGWSVIMCYFRGGGRVGEIPAVGKHGGGNLDDEERAAAEGLLGSGEDTEEDERPVKMQARDAGGRDRRAGGGMGVMDALRELDGGRRGAEDEWGDAPTGVQVKSDGTARYCRKCASFKPDRAHHCSSCGYCVLKMDHHCPWLGGGCVGWANYKFFLLFLCYSGALGLFVAATTLSELIDFVSEDPNNFELAPIAWALVFFLGVIFGLSIGLFASYHLYLAARNRTTLENMEGAGSVLPSSSRDPHAHFRPDHALSRRERWKLEKAQSKFNVYDHGVKANLTQIFGGWESRWIWLLPVGWPPGDGTSFPVDREKLTKLRSITSEIRLGRGRDEEEAPARWEDPRAVRRA